MLWNHWVTHQVFFVLFSLPFAFVGGFNVAQVHFILLQEYVSPSNICYKCLSFE